MWTRILSASKFYIPEITLFRNQHDSNWCYQSSQPEWDNCASLPGRALTKPAITKSLAKIISLCLLNRVFRASRRIAEVTSVFKAGDHTNVWQLTVIYLLVCCLWCLSYSFVRVRGKFWRRSRQVSLQARSTEPAYSGSGLFSNSIPKISEFHKGLFCDSFCSSFH